MRTTRTPFVCLLFTLALACDRAPAPPGGPADSAGLVAQAAGPALLASASTAKNPPPVIPTGAPVAPVAIVGEKAPAFHLKDLDGRPVALADFAGKVVVLEWFNPGCPFVRAAHTKGSLVDAAARAEKDGVVWLAINSGAPGQQGHGIEANKKGAETFGLKHPVLLDEEGRVGRSYGALKTPHLFVIDEQGTLVYAGAVDNSPDGEGESPEGPRLVRYVDQALAELRGKKPISVPTTKPYGCSVKYGK